MTDEGFTARGCTHGGRSRAGLHLSERGGGCVTTWRPLHEACGPGLPPLRCARGARPRPGAARAAGAAGAGRGRRGAPTGAGRPAARRRHSGGRDRPAGLWPLRALLPRRVGLHRGPPRPHLCRARARRGAAPALCCGSVHAARRATDPRPRRAGPGHRPAPPARLLPGGRRAAARCAAAPGPRRAARRERRGAADPCAGPPAQASACGSSWSSARSSGSTRRWSGRA